MIFIIYLISLLACSLFFYYRISLLENAYTSVQNTMDVKLKLEQTISNLRDAESEQRGYLITRDSLFMEHYDSAYARVFRRISEIEILCVDDPAQTENTRILKELAQKRFATLASTMNSQEYYTGTALQQREYLIMGKQVMDAVREKVDTMRKIQNRLLVIRKEKQDSAIELTPLYALGVILFSIGVMIACYVIIQRSNTSQVNLT